MDFGIGPFLVSGHFSPRRSYLKMDLKSEIFDFFQPICFCKAETKLEMNYFGIFRIRGHLRS